MEKKYYIFDMDGTLIDSMPSYGGAVLKYLEINKIAHPDDTLKTVTPLGYKGAAKHFIEALGCTATVEEICEDFKNLMIDDYLYTIPEKEGVTETLKELKKQGHSLSVLTASPHVTLDPCLKRLGLYDLFDFVWSSEDFGLTKAEVEIYHRCAEKLGTTVDKCIFLDDNFNACETAKKSGMTVYGVYDKSSEDYIDDMVRITNKYIRKFDELI
ncbi:MAG: HAD-IA family hydrolase [Clostridia bacterium]|nr:HAD-IA family hydrolase [Clostridia bacterium]